MLQVRLPERPSNYNVEERKNSQLVARMMRKFVAYTYKLLNFSDLIIMQNVQQ